MRKCQVFTIKIFLLVAFFSACSLFMDTSPIVKKDKSLKTNFKGQGWSKIKKSGADFAFQKKNAYLYATSICPSPKENLQKLTLALLTQEKNIISQKEYNKDDLDILFSEGRFQIEDANFHLYLTNYKDEKCYYEYVLLNQGEISPEMQKDYQNFLDSFKH